MFTSLSRGEGEHEGSLSCKLPLKQNRTDLLCLGGGRGGETLSNKWWLDQEGDPRRDWALGSLFPSGLGVEKAEGSGVWEDRLESP